jgi:hypothetical protein
MKWMRFKNIASVKSFSKPEQPHPGNQSSYQLITAIGKLNNKNDKTKSEKVILVNGIGTSGTAYSVILSSP